MLELSDSSLVARCINGEKLAWNGFVERFSGLIFWAIRDRLEQRGYGYNQEDAKDIFQNVFVLLWEKKKLHQIRNREGISAWLVMVAANCTCNYFRSKKDGLPKEELIAQSLASSDGNPSNRINQEKLYATLVQSFAYLSARERIALELNYLHGKTHQQIAGILKMPQNSVSSVVRRTKEKLKEHLENNET